MIPASDDADVLRVLETHDPGRLREMLDLGLDARAPIRGKAPLVWLTELYTRSPALSSCVRLLLDRGGILDDPALAPVLLDDGPGVARFAARDPAWIRHRTTMPSAFTPLRDATLLHVASEFGNAEAARALLVAGAEVDAPAGLDEHGLGGQTPLYHTVNSNANHAAPVLRLLLAAGASPERSIAGLTWGKGFDWESTFFDLTPIAYAQLGLLPQMHRREEDVVENVRALLSAARRPVPPAGNVPNRYLLSR